MKRLIAFVFFAVLCAHGDVLSSIAPALERYKIALNSRNPDSLMSFVSDSFSYRGLEHDVSMAYLRQLVTIYPYKIVGFDNIDAKETDENVVVTLTVVSTVNSTMNDTTDAFFIFEKLNGAIKILTIDDEAPAHTKNIDIEQKKRVIPPPKFYSFDMKDGKLLLRANFPKIKDVPMVLHNTITKSRISSKFSEVIGYTDGTVPEIESIGLKRSKFSVDLTDADSGMVGSEYVVGALGRNFFDGNAILLDFTMSKLTLIPININGELQIPLTDFGIFAEPKGFVRLLGAYSFDVISADFGLGVETPVAIDLSAGESKMFADFFEGLPGNVIDNEKKASITKNIGANFSPAYISAGNIKKIMPKVVVMKKQSDSGFNYPEGMAGILGVGFFTGGKMLINYGDMTIKIFD
jgi:hypothetical protein